MRPYTLHERLEKMNIIDGGKPSKRAVKKSAKARAILNAARDLDTLDAAKDYMPQLLPAPEWVGQTLLERIYAARLHETLTRWVCRKIAASVRTSADGTTTYGHMAGAACARLMASNWKDAIYDDLCAVVLEEISDCIIANQLMEENGRLVFGDRTTASGETKPAIFRLWSAVEKTLYLYQETSNHAAAGVELVSISALSEYDAPADEGGKERVINKDRIAYIQQCAWSARANDMYGTDIDNFWKWCAAHCRRPAKIRRLKTVYAMLVDGYNTADIAFCLNVSEAVVKKCRRVTRAFFTAWRADGGTLITNSGTSHVWTSMIPFGPSICDGAALVKPRGVKTWLHGYQYTKPRHKDTRDTWEECYRYSRIASILSPETIDAIDHTIRTPKAPDTSADKRAAEKAAWDAKQSTIDFHALPAWRRDALCATLTPATYKALRGF